MSLFSQLPQIEARLTVQYGRYASAGRVAVTTGVTEHDVNLGTAPSPLPGMEYRLGTVNIAPMVTMNKPIPFGVVPLPSKSDFTTGFRVEFAAPAPAGLEIHYALPITP